jgi:hypothetical protein
MIDRQFIIERQGRSFVLYAGLLDLAHAQGLKSIRTQLIQVPNESNNQTAIVSAEVTTDRGTFAGLADASPANVSRAMLTATIRLAETRAKARALRDAVNVGVAAFEELDEDAPVVEQHRPAPASAPTPAPTPIRVQIATGANQPTASQLVIIDQLATTRHIDVDAASTRLFGRPLAELDRHQMASLISSLRRDGKAS